MANQPDDSAADRLRKQEADLNPSQTYYSREFDGAAHDDAPVTDSTYEKQAGRNASDGDPLASQRDTNDREKTSLDDTVAGKAAVGAVSAIGSPIAGAAAKIISKIKVRKRTTVGLAIGGVLIALVFLIAGFLGPALLPMHIKQVLVDKFDDYASVVDTRGTMILKKRITGVFNGTCQTKVLCRDKGLSKGQIKRLERAGWKIDSTGRKILSTRTLVNSITSPDGVKIDAKSIGLIDTDPHIRGQLKTVFDPYYTAFTTKAFTLFARATNLDKRPKISGNTPEEINKSLKESIGGVGDDADKLGKNAITEKDGKYYDETGKEVTKTQADAIKANAAEFSNVSENIAKTGQKAVLGVGKGAVLTTITGGAASADLLCTGYYFTQAVGYGVKVIGQQQLIRFVWSLVMNPSDMTKAGDITDKQLEVIGKKLTTPDKNSEAFTDGFGYKYAAYGDLALPQGKTPEETDIKRGEVFQYALGGGLGGGLLTFTSLLNQYTGNAPQTVCGAIKEPAAQIGLMIGGVALAVGTGGFSAIPGAAQAAAITAAVSSVILISLPILNNLVAGEQVSDKTVGGDASNAATAGAGAMNAQLSHQHGLSPQTKGQRVAFDRFAEDWRYRNTIAMRSVANPFDLSNPHSASFTLASALTTNAPTSIDQLANYPSKLIAQAKQSLIPSASALDEQAQYNMCKDQDYVQKDYAADPFCNIRYGLSQREMELDTEDVAKYMHNNGHVDDDGNSKSADFKTYIDICIQRTEPLGSTGLDGQEDDGSRCNEDKEEYRYFRVYYVDTMLTDNMDEEDTFQIGGDDLKSTAADADTGGSITSVTGTDQEIAQKIMSSPNINGDGRYMRQIQQYADGNTSCHINSDILKLILSLSQKHKLTISSLNRYCTGVLTASGTASYHYAEQGGHAVDFNWVGGVHSNGGANATDAAMLQDALKILPTGSGIGQSNCRSGEYILTLPTGIREFGDSCNHIHIQVPKK